MIKRQPFINQQFQSPFVLLKKFFVFYIMFFLFSRLYKKEVLMDIFITEISEYDFKNFIYNISYKELFGTNYINDPFSSLSYKIIRDEELIRHSIRATELAVKIAEEMGINSEELIKIKNGSLFHDIGKLNVPISILFKEDMLIEHEFEILKKHPEFACELLDRYDFVEDFYEIPLCHHERWNGTGYPRGLKKEEIPLSARIFAVADVYDALTNIRPYRPAWTYENAVNYIIQQSGKHFDPDVVEAFLKVINKVIKKD
jgi:putative nucleotidyltransferase with HDIG domain